MILNHLNLLANKNFDGLIKKLNCSRGDLDKAVEIIKALNPKPGLAFKKINQNDFIRPDITVVNENGSWEVYVNEDELLKLRVNNEHEKSLKDMQDDVTEDLKEKLQEAKWLIKNLQQRSITILRVSRSIMRHQKDFLQKKLFQNHSVLVLEMVCLLKTYQ